MGMDNISDKVNINVGDTGRSGGGGDAGAMAALVAALGNRNNGSDNAALVAALGQRNEGAGLGGIGALLAANGGGFGANGMAAIWPLLLLGLLGRRGGFGGGDGDCCNGPDHAALIGAIASGVNGLTAAVPTAALETQGVVQSAIAQLALAGQQGFSNVKDSVNAASAVELAAISGTKDSIQNLALGLSQAICGVNQNVSAQGCETREAVDAGTDRVLSALQGRWTAEDQAQIVSLRNELTELRNDGRRRSDHDELRLQITNTNTAVAAQAQGQQQQQQQQQFALLQQLVPCFQSLVGDIQAVKQGQVIFNSGTMAASGTQAAANTRVA